MIAFKDHITRLRLLKSSVINKFLEMKVLELKCFYQQRRFK